ncbi:MAG TPA: hypothetical protein VLX92_10230 [Kofleriaceae bacterium]|nr:hypothetical protein [Kofleriaceae bacterium]
MGRALIFACVLAGCAGDPAPAQTPRQFFDRNVAPILAQSCATNTAGCHAQGQSLHVALVGPDVYDAITTDGTCGEFTDAAPLLSAHAPDQYTNADARFVIEQWFERERDVDR